MRRGRMAAVALALAAVAAGVGALAALRSSEPLRIVVDRPRALMDAPLSIELRGLDGAEQVVVRATARRGCRARCAAFRWSTSRARSGGWRASPESTAGASTCEGSRAARKPHC